jgi:hypothetical protein
MPSAGACRLKQGSPGVIEKASQSGIVYWHARIEHRSEAQNRAPL